MSNLSVEILEVMKKAEIDLKLFNGLTKRDAVLNHFKQQLGSSNFMILFETISGIIEMIIGISKKTINVDGIQSKIGLFQSLCCK
jgi:hypothetical protein